MDLRIDHQSQLKPFISSKANKEHCDRWEQTDIL